MDDFPHVQRPVEYHQIGPGAPGNAPASANLGTLVPSADLTSATLVKGTVPARCEGRGILLIGNPPAMGSYVLPGNNYHVYDYSLFWANVRADAERRLAAYKAAWSRANQGTSGLFSPRAAA